MKRKVDLRYLRFIGGLKRCERGSASVEFALGAGFIMVLIAMVADFGMAFYDNMSLENAARAGAQYAVNNGVNETSIADVVRNATTLDPSGLTIASSRFCECADSSTISCSNQVLCPVAGGKRTFVTVTVDHTFTPLLPYQGLETSIPLRGQVTLRIQ